MSVVDGDRLRAMWDELCPGEPKPGRDPVLMDQYFRVVLLSLSPRHYEAISLRFGLEDGTRRTYREVGVLLSISGTRVQQMVDKLGRRARWHLHFAYWRPPRETLEPFRGRRP